MADSPGAGGALWGAFPMRLDLAPLEAAKPLEGKTVSPDIIATIISAISTVLTLGGLVWRFGSKLGRLDQRLARFGDQLDRFDAELREIKAAIEDARLARGNLWQETNKLRERMARLEALNP